MDLFGFDVRLGRSLSPFGRCRGKVPHVPVHRPRVGAAFPRDLSECEAGEGSIRERSVHAGKEECAGLAHVGKPSLDFRPGLLGGFPRDVDVDQVHGIPRRRVHEFGSGSSGLHGHDDHALMGASLLAVLEVGPARPEHRARIDEEATARSLAGVGVVDVAPRVVVASDRQVVPSDPVNVLAKALWEVLLDRGVELKDP